MHGDDVTRTPGDGLLTSFEAWWERYHAQALESSASGEQRLHYAYVQAGDGGLHMIAIDGHSLHQTRAMLWSVMRKTPNPHTAVLSVELWGSTLDPSKPRDQKLIQRMQAGKLEVKDLPRQLRYDMVVIAGQAASGETKLVTYRISPPAEKDGPRTHTETPARAGIREAIFPLFPPPDGPTATWGGRTVRIS